MWQYSFWPKKNEKIIVNETLYILFSPLQKKLCRPLLPTNNITMQSASILFLVAAAWALSIVDATYCPCGSYCPDPAKTYKAPKKCPVRNFCPKGGHNQTTEPHLCPAGRVCPHKGLCEPLGCPSGYYCVAGSSQGTICPANFYCPANSSAPVRVCVRVPCALALYNLFLQLSCCPQ